MAAAAPDLAQGAAAPELIARSGIEGVDRDPQTLRHGGEQTARDGKAGDQLCQFRAGDADIFEHDIEAAPAIEIHELRAQRGAPDKVGEDLPDFADHSSERPAPAAILLSRFVLKPFHDAAPRPSGFHRLSITLYPGLALLA